MKMAKININEGYEIYQVITDFEDPLEIFREAFQNAVDEDATEVFCRVYNLEKFSGSKLIIDIWNNGKGLERNNVENFFDLANSTKVDENRMPKKGKLGYKGHGAKIFFNSQKVVITSRTESDNWSVELDEPIQQIEENNEINYSDFLSPDQTKVQLPQNWMQGFFVRIIGHLHFKTEHTKFKLNHANLRDYSKWFTVFGSIMTEFDEQLKNKKIKLYLSGLGIDSFGKESKRIIPEPILRTIDEQIYEEITLGHYFPPERYTDSSMKAYVKEIKSQKSFWEYYSRMAHKNTENCPHDISFDLIINIEGYETKRLYDFLLINRGKSRTEISHGDDERYGLWACKGGIPIERIDHWLEGGKGGYSFIQAFVNCEDFKLTSNRGAIRNTDIEKLDILKKEVNKIFNSSTIKYYINERAEIENIEKKLISIEEDEKKLSKRFSDAKKSKKIILPDAKFQLKEPQKLKNGYSESETFFLLAQITTMFPDLFVFKIEDYNTTDGIDFVIQENGYPRYIELKGSLHKSINHPFKHISRFICYDLDLKSGDIVEDLDESSAKLVINSQDRFPSFDERFQNKPYVSYKLDPLSASITSMEIIVLKEIIEKILRGDITS
jgi:hypothetical protein